VKCAVRPTGTTSGATQTQGNKAATESIWGQEMCVSLRPGGKGNKEALVAGAGQGWRQR
jgi:hypothetical protein